MTKSQPKLIDPQSTSSAAREPAGRTFLITGSLASATDGRGVSPPTAVAFDEDVEVDAAALLAQVMHDCPDCRAALARGEQPIIQIGLPRQSRAVRRRMKALTRER
jgi:hypothetical protein